MLEVQMYETFVFWFHCRVCCALCNCVSNSVLGQGELICFGRISGFPRHSSSPLLHKNLRADYSNPHYAMAGGSHPPHSKRSPHDGEYQDVKQYPRPYRTEDGNTTVHHGEVLVR